jgi:nicotinamidase-related amidase
MIIPMAATCTQGRRSDRATAIIPTVATYTQDCRSERATVIIPTVATYTQDCRSERATATVCQRKPTMLISPRTWFTRLRKMIIMKELYCQTAQLENSENGPNASTTPRI